MHEHPAPTDECPARQIRAPLRNERGIRLVVLLTAVMMGIEIVVGYATNSMALLADGWHMATHVGALGLASLAYWVSRRFAQHRAFTFGTGKVRALAGYTSAVALAIVAFAMMVESLQRLVHPHAIDFTRSLPVAVLGLGVNLASVALLHTHREAPDHSHQDHNHRAAFLHVVADTFTSALAILALLAGRFLGWSWLDAVIGILGGVVILKWSVGLSRSAAVELLDMLPSATLEEEIRTSLEAMEGVRVCDLHVWSIGDGIVSCIVTLETAIPREAHLYREALARFQLAHLTIEIQRCMT